jgi:hypothetical protein
MISLSILGFALGTVAQLAALFASSKFAFANGAASAGTAEISSARPIGVARSEVATASEPAWANLMRGM